MWPQLVSALSGFGEVCAISRNQHVVLGGRCSYPVIDADPAGPDEPCFHHDFSEWEEGWFYREMVHGQLMAGIEIRDATGLGFHKILLTEESRLDFAEVVMRAFEQDPLTEEEVAEAMKANHLDGACGPTCEARTQEDTREHLAMLQEFIQRAMTQRKPMGAMLFHPGLVSLRRFVPEQWIANGLWTGVAGESTRLFFRPSGFGSVKFSRLDPTGAGPCDVAAIRRPDGDLLATLIIED
jgi:hypothetical protein